MTTTPTLAETIARVARNIDLQLPNGQGITAHVLDLSVLLACARRCEAMERVKDRPTPCHTSNLGPIDGPSTPHMMYVAQIIDPYIDQLLAERDALAKRVKELEERLSKLAEHYRDFQEEADDEGASNGAIEDMLGHVETAIAGIPIADPTQGTELCPACGDQRVYSVPTRPKATP